MSAPSSRRVLLLVGSGADVTQRAVLETESTPFGKLLAQHGGAIELNMVSWGVEGPFEGMVVHARLEQASRPAADRLLRAVGVYSLRRRFERFPIGRLLNSIGPVAPSRVFWRAMKQHPEALHLLRSSDIAIATDLESTKAAWIAVHRGWVDDAYFDHRALALLQGERPVTTS